MLDWIMKMMTACWRPVERYAHMGAQVSDRHDALLWYRDLLPHAAGEFSIAVVQANALLEDQSQVETGAYGTFVGVYDGHGGPEAARFINDNMFPNVKSKLRCFPPCRRLPALDSCPGRTQYFCRA
jgi:pyruvate dehydrogenase phosphatase